MTRWYQKKSIFGSLIAIGIVLIMIDGNFINNVKGEDTMVEQEFSIVVPEDEVVDLDHLVAKYDTGEYGHIFTYSETEERYEVASGESILVEGTLVLSSVLLALDSGIVVTGEIRIAQLTDVHISKVSIDEYDYFGRLAELKAAIEYFNRNDYDLILITGDLCQLGRYYELWAFGSIVVESDIPVFLIPGNHDHFSFGDIFYSNFLNPKVNEVNQRCEPEVISEKSPKKRAGRWRVASHLTQNDKEFVEWVNGEYSEEKGVRAVMWGHTHESHTYFDITTNENDPNADNALYTTKKNDFYNDFGDYDTATVYYDPNSASINHDEGKYKAPVYLETENIMRRNAI